MEGPSHTHPATEAPSHTGRATTPETRAGRNTRPKKAARAPAATPGMQRAGQEDGSLRATMSAAGATLFAAIGR
jgi:hypothetical protein